MADNYTRGIALGEGTWGLVYEATRKIDNLRVAIKRIKPMDPHLGINFTALREIKYLQEFKNPNVVKLIEAFFNSGVLHLVLEFCPHDLEKVIRDKTIVLKTVDIKCYLQMILKGVQCCHSNFVLHRDLKPANLLIAPDGTLKLADFGLARNHSSPEQLTSEVVTRWYRAPELLFGAPLYAGGVDMWAVGCIFAEMLFRVPMFPGNTDLEQLGKIFNVLGTPTSVSWPDVELLPNYLAFEPREPMNLLPLFRSSPAATTDKTSHPPDLALLLRMLTLNPIKRISAEEALAHPYFSHLPLPCQPTDLQLPAIKGGIAQSQSDDVDVKPDLKRMKV